MKTEKEIKPSGAAQPISLAPLSFKEALAGMLATKPPPKREKKSAKKKPTKKR
jgi:hypothetical protein